ncbi:MAG: hypothetical protein ACKVOJ_11375 [Sphingomonadaceae bacterium]
MTRALTGLSILALGAGFVALNAQTPPTTICDTATTRFCNSIVPLPVGWRGPTFTLSQDYPTSVPSDAQPWRSIDPKTNPDQYIRTVLGYFFEGNIRKDMAISFDPRLNTVRKWYHAPWQDVGANGREPIHGLTRERTSEAKELSPRQTQRWLNYAVGFYNAPGGMMLGKVWADHDQPNPAAATAPEGTVAAKLLFSTASEAEVPWIKGAPGWDAYVYKDVHKEPSAEGTDPRAVRRVHLLQIDIAVKDARSPIGWVFGTFAYGGGPTGKPGAGWYNVAPVGLMWGNDPDYSGKGDFKEAWINKAVKLHRGYQGRLNGPVDNPRSSCLSCHMTAQGIESIGTLVNNLLPPNPSTPADIAKWFQNIKSGVPFTPHKTSLDYSMQVAFGISGFESLKTARNQPDPAERVRLKAEFMRDSALSSRGGPD